jgi:hypothetical protein
MAMKIGPVKGSTKLRLVFDRRNAALMGVIPTVYGLDIEPCVIGFDCGVREHLGEYAGEC